MNLLLIIPLYPPLVGGCAAYFDILVRHLKNRDDMNIIILTRFAKNAPLVEKEENVLILRLLMPGFRWLKKRIFSTLITSSLSKLLFPFLVYYILRVYKINLIHIHMQIFHSFYHTLRILKKRMNIVIDLRGIGELPVDTLKLHKCCDKLICASENTFEYTLHHGFPSKKCKHIPIPVELPPKKTPEEVKTVQTYYRIPVEHPYLCFVGSIARQKGIYELVNAFERFSAKHRNYNLIFVGKNMEGRKFLTLLRSNERIFYIGPVSHDDAISLMQGASMVILPSQQEALGRVCLEAISLGKKVICPPGVPELARYCPEFTLDKVCAADIESKIEQVLNLDIMPKYPFQKHDVNNSIEQVYKLYRELNVQLIS